MSYQTPPADKDNTAARQPPGWYPDPRWYLHRTGPQVLRWWDGAQWGQQTQPPRRGQEPQLGYPQQPSFTPDPQYGTPPRRARRVLLIIGGAFTALIVLIVIIAVATAKPVATKPAAAASTSAPAVHPAVHTAAPTTAPITATATPTPPPATTAPTGPTASQQQALAQAQGYLSDGQGFSRAGLITQLDSPDGGQFSVADATWAVDNSGANWDAQAVIAAKGYLGDGQGFSRSALIAQLDSPYGGKFTYAQAVYGADQAGL